MTQTLTQAQAVGLALIPCAAESAADAALRSGNMTRYGAALGMKYTRNTVYIGTVFTAAAATAAYTTDSETKQFAYKIATGIGLGVTAYAFNKLNYFASLFKVRYNTNVELRANRNVNQ